MSQAKLIVKDETKAKKKSIFKKPTHKILIITLTLSYVFPFTFAPRPAQAAGQYPTDGVPSPLFGAGSFEQKMVLFEEFGTEPLPEGEADSFKELPLPVNTRRGPAPAELEEFLAQEGVAPFPARLSNVSAENPWNPMIEQFLGRELVAPATGIGVAGPAEGRPGGEWWAHQRWEEFYPQSYYKTAQAGARVNGGFRDSRQRHGYNVGEFASGGLYNTVYTASVSGAPTLTGTTNGLPIQIHPKMPVQNPESVWTFDGTLPPKLLQVRNGQAALMRHYNALPIDPTANRGFGRHTITTHEHNGHNPGESDGFAGAFYYPGQFWDYRWPLQLAGYDTVNIDASDPRAAFPCEPGEILPVDDDDDGIPTPKTCENGSIKIRGDWRETMSTHWFHDHMLDHTAENVYKGNAVMMNYYSVLDRGNEAFDDGVNLRFPSGTALSWGNRDYDINLLVADKAWDRQGQLWFSHNSADGHDGFIGDRVLANWLYHPYFEVRARSYRFRVLNGAVSRIFALALVQQVQGDAGELAGPAGSGVSYNRVPFYLIANDGNIMEHAVPFDGSLDLDGDGELLDHKGQLPSQGIAERYDIIVDFSKNGIRSGDKLYFVNVMEHLDGKGSNGKIPLADVMSERYKAETIDDDGDSLPDRWINGDPAVGKFLELRVAEYAGQDQSMNPADYVAGKKKMIELPIDRSDPALAAASRHTFEFVHSGGDSETPWKIRVDGGDQLPMDPHRVSALMRGETEIWDIQGNRGWTHPVHIHFEEGLILKRGGLPPPEWEKWARKDLYRVGPEDDSDVSVEVAIRARDFVGTFVEHCHNTMHEDHAMLLRWDAMRPDQLELAPTPVPGWDGVEFASSFTDPTHDMRAPVITVLGDNPATVSVGAVYTDAGASAVDDVDGDITAHIVTSGLPINTATAGSLTVAYAVADAAGNRATASRTVNVVPAPPVLDRISLDPATSTLIVGDILDFQARGRDQNNNVMEAPISWSVDHPEIGSIDQNGRFTALAAGTVAVTASSGEIFNTSHVTVVAIPPDTTPPVITILGDNPAGITVGNPYSDAGATAVDAVDGAVPVRVSSTVNAAVVGTYSVTYSATDAAGNSSSALRIVKVVAADTTSPVITILGDNPASVTQGSAYSDAGANASDNVDGDLTSSIITSGLPLSTAAAGTFTVTYNVTDLSGNTASAVRTVKVVALAPTPSSGGGGGGGSFSSGSSGSGSFGSGGSGSSNSGSVSTHSGTPASEPSSGQSQKQVLGERIFADGMLVRDKSSKKIFLIFGNLKKRIANLAELKKHAGQGITETEGVNLFGLDEVRSLPEGSPNFENGTLLKSKTSKKIFILENGRKRHIRTLTELRRLGKRARHDVDDNTLALFADSGLARR